MVMASVISMDQQHLTAGVSQEYRQWIRMAQFSFMKTIRRSAQNFEVTAGGKTKKNMIEWKNQLFSNEFQ
jgi:hypothetical protein